MTRKLTEFIKGARREKAFSGETKEDPIMKGINYVSVVKHTDVPLSNVLSNCHQAPMRMLENSNVGICSSCKKFAYDNSKKEELRDNRFQNFEKVTDNPLYH